jgi:hypothetical protein
VSSFGNPFTLGFLPVTAIEEAGGLETWPVDIVEAARVDVIPSGWERGT